MPSCDSPAGAAARTSVSIGNGCAALPPPDSTYWCPLTTGKRIAPVLASTVKETRRPVLVSVTTNLAGSQPVFALTILVPWESKDEPRAIGYTSAPLRVISTPLPPTNTGSRSIPIAWSFRVRGPW